jgi:hypothetical protein
MAHSVRMRDYKMTTTTTVEEETTEEVLTEEEELAIVELTRQAVRIQEYLQAGKQSDRQVGRILITVKDSPEMRISGFTRVNEFVSEYLSEGYSLTPGEATEYIQFAQWTDVLEEAGITTAETFSLSVYRGVPAPKLKKNQKKVIAKVNSLLKKNEKVTQKVLRELFPKASADSDSVSEGSTEDPETIVEPSSDSEEDVWRASVSNLQTLIRGGFTPAKADMETLQEFLQELIENK